MRILLDLKFELFLDKERACNCTITFSAIDHCLHKNNVITIGILLMIKSHHWKLTFFGFYRALAARVPGELLALQCWVASNSRGVRNSILTR